MPGAPSSTLIERARIATARGDWAQAFALLLEADASSPLMQPELGFLAEMAYASGHPEVTIEAWERAHADGLRTGDALAAAGAAVRVAMHLVMDTGLMAPVRGWLGRTERLLEGVAETPVHAWLAVVRNYERLLSGDFEGALRWAQRAIDLGTIHEPAAAAIGRVALARSLIFRGDVEPGLALLDEAAVAAVSGEIDPLTTGIVYCEVVCGLQGAAQYDQAEEWTLAMERWRHGHSVGGIHGRCRVHRAEILRLRGSCDEAEEEAQLACEELRPYLRRELGWPLCELGRIRFRKGDFQGAEEAFLEAHELGWDPQPGLALVHLVRGDTARAAASVREALERPEPVPSKELPPNTQLRRVPLLEAQVEIEIAAGDLDRAERAAMELRRAATSFRSNALAASAALADGRVHMARGDGEAARCAFEAAVLQWSEIGAPYETSLARLGLADALRAAGQEERALLELRAARASFERIGAVHQMDRAARACAEPVQVSDTASRTAEPPNDTPPNDTNVLSCEGDYWLVVFGGSAARVRDSKGLRYLARLLAAPGRELTALELVALERSAPEGEVPSHTDSDAGPLLDVRAKDAYRRRLTEIEEDLAEAHALGDIARLQQASAEREFLARELSRAVGLGGRERRAGSASERARSAVTRAMRQALARIREHHPALAEHLDRTIRTGTQCVYLPDTRLPTTWKV
jgi:tetratricopeptide (TPR) repeat protein